MVLFITYADVCVDPTVPVPDWRLSATGRQRHAGFNDHKFVRHITAIHCSDERKALDGAEILSGCTGLTPHIAHDLRENDRSSTGFLPPAGFQTIADQFFSFPTHSIRGWERAVDAQSRIVKCINRIIDDDTKDGHIAIISHGGVGALLLCSLSNAPISRAFEQPGTHGGNYFAFRAQTRELVHPWCDIAEQASR